MLVSITMNYLIGSRISKYLDTPEKAETHNRENLEALEGEFLASGARQLILSGEDLSDLRASGFARLREWLLQWGNELKVVCALRNPVSWSISAAQSSIRGGKTYGEVNRDPPLQRLRGRLGACIEAFGRDLSDTLGRRYTGAS